MGDTRVRLSIVDLKLLCSIIKWKGKERRAEIFCLSLTIPKTMCTHSVDALIETGNGQVLKSSKDSKGGYKGD